MIYAGYYNLSASDKAARLIESRRASEMTTTSNASEVKPHKSTLKRVLHSLRATEETITPTGIYTPIIKNGPLFSVGDNATAQKNTVSGIYTPIIKNGPLFSSKRGSQSSA